MNVKSQTLLISSRNSANSTSDTPYDYGIVLAPGLVRCRPEQKLRMSLKRMSCRANWQWVPQNCSFTVTLLQSDGYVPHNVVLAAGNPSFRDLASGITKQVGVSGFSCTYDKAASHLVFFYISTSNLSQPFIQLDFTAFPNVQQLLGFGEGSGVIVYSDGATLRSREPLNDTPFNSVKVHVSGVTPESHSANATNLGANEFVQECNILAAFAVDSSAFGLMDYRNVDQSFTMTLTDKAIRSLRFHFTDWSDRPLTQLTDHHLYLQIDTLAPQMTLQAFMARLLGS